MILTIEPQNGYLEVQNQSFFESMESNFPVRYDTFETGMNRSGPKLFKSVEFLTIWHVWKYIQYDKRKKNKNIWTQNLVKNEWAYFHFTVLKKVFIIDTAKNSTDLNSLSPQLSIAGLKSAVAHREDAQLFAQS